MGLSASQGRLLSITSRLSSNEYESQQISNAKMRLAAQSQEASQEYISALNKESLNLVTFDNSGNSVTTPLTAAALYEYNDSKNQYLLTNSAGKVYITSEDANYYKESSDMQTFLEKHGLKKIFKTDTLSEKYDDVNKLKAYKTDYENAIKQIKNSYSNEQWANDKSVAQMKYLNDLNAYNLVYNQQQEGNNVSNNDLEKAQTDMENSRQEFLKLVSYDTAIESILKENNLTIYNNYQEYKSALTVYNDELNSEGLSPAFAYEWDDKTKAQWYTNLWFRLNGSSTGNTNSKNFIVLENNELNKSGWVSDSILKGTVNIESVNYNGAEMTLRNENNPFIFNLNGIEWNAKIYSSCPDIIAANNEKSVAKAEAEYQRKTVEINAKDEKYQRKLSLLDSEHHAIQTEYDSVKSAIEKNISRSFKAFQG